MYPDESRSSFGLRYDFECTLSSMYRFDARDKASPAFGRHYSDESVFGVRAAMRVPPGGGVSDDSPTPDTTPATPARLAVDRLVPEDAGRYKCRVDFKKSPTKNYRMNLTVLSKYLNTFRLLFTGGPQQRMYEPTGYVAKVFLEIFILLHFILICLVMSGVSIKNCKTRMTVQFGTYNQTCTGIH